LESPEEEDEFAGAVASEAVVVVVVNSGTSDADGGTRGFIQVVSLVVVL